MKISSNFYLFNYNLKGGDIAVHLSGILSFLILLSDYFKMRNLLFYLLIICWFTLFLFVAFVGRAAFLTIVITWIFLSFFSKPHKYFIWLLVFLIVVFVFIVFDIAIETGSEREISLQQLYLNIKSIFYRIDEFSGEGSKLWRLLWWKEIINYTFFGDYFWFGKGYGINLADDDGFQVDINHSLRSPHNGHLTFLARSGVPGFTLWLIFLFFLFKDLFKTFLKLKSANLFFDANIYLFVFCYLFSFVINGAFDVFLEGPQGGIWFWSIVGFAISIIHLENAINR